MAIPKLGGRRFNDPGNSHAEFSKGAYFVVDELGPLLLTIHPAATGSNPRLRMTSEATIIMIIILALYRTNDR